MSITRIVQMTFQPEAIQAFLKLFEERKSLIRNFPGCEHLELWQDKADKRIFFTYSKWDAEASLNSYRISDFFTETWEITKRLFADKPHAWTVHIAATAEKENYTNFS
jgi:heme-degrading monooxygenase HmoA